MATSDGRRVGPCAASAVDRRRVALRERGLEELPNLERDSSLNASLSVVSQWRVEPGEVGESTRTGDAVDGFTIPSLPLESVPPDDRTRRSPVRVRLAPFA